MACLEFAATSAIAERPPNTHHGPFHRCARRGLPTTHNRFIGGRVPVWQAPFPCAIDAPAPRLMTRVCLVGELSYPTGVARRGCRYGSLRLIR